MRFEVVVALVGLLTASPCRADEPSTTPVCVDCVRPGDRLHDGFFARGVFGASFLFAQVETDPRVPPFRSRIRGIGESSEIAIGGTPEPGLVVGGTVWTARIDPTFVENGRTISPDDDSVKVTLARFGPFIDLYPNPRRGFHALASAALAFSIESDVKGNVIEPAALGAALAIGAGYEWFVGRDLSLGFVARMAIDRVTRRYLGSREDTLAAVPELGLAYTYH